MARGRHGARRLLVQALYQHQLGGHGASELVAQYSDRKEFRSADAGYFLELVREVIAATASLDELITEGADRPATQLDPIERAILWIGLAELRSHPDVPRRVVIDEAIELAKEFGAQDGFRFVNAVLDVMAARLRPAEGVPGAG
jgi:N utilization substance protein B